MILKICNLSFVCSIRLHSIRLNSIRLHSVRLHSVRLHSLVASLHSVPLVFFSLSPPQHSASCKLRFDCDLQMAKLNKLAEPCLGEEKTVIKMWTQWFQLQQMWKDSPSEPSTVRLHVPKGVPIAFPYMQFLGGCPFFHCTSPKWLFVVVGVVAFFVAVLLVPSLSFNCLALQSSFRLKHTYWLLSYLFQLHYKILASFVGAVVLWSVLIVFASCQYAFLCA